MIFGQPGPWDRHCYGLLEGKKMQSGAAGDFSSQAIKLSTTLGILHWFPAYDTVLRSDCITVAIKIEIKSP